MIQSQESTRLNYHPSRDKYYNITSKSAEPAAYGKPLGLFNPRSKLLFIQRSLQKLSDYQLIGIPYVQEYLLSQYRRNRSINTIRTNFCSIHQFLKFLKKLGRQRFEEITCDDLSTYIEYEQDQGKKPMTVDSRLRSLKAFFNYHVDRDNVDAAVLKHKLRIKLPQRLPRAIDPEDVRRL